MGNNMNKISKEASIIAELLRKEKINFSTEKVFSDLKSYKGISLRYDFAIYDDFNNLTYLLEYDSIIHFKRVPHFHKTDKEFLNGKGRDRIKNQYALAHNIPLIRIPYWDLDKVTVSSIFNLPQYRVRTMYHNDNLINAQR